MTIAANVSTDVERAIEPLNPDNNVSIRAACERIHPLAGISGHMGADKGIHPIAAGLAERVDVGSPVRAGEPLME